MTKARLIWVTPDAERIIGYCARVSNPANQDNPNVAKLLGYCIRNAHWSIFEMANMCIEIETSRAISGQILRHKSFSFGEFSQRYSENTEITEYTARRQDLKNRQNSIDDLPDRLKGQWEELQNYINNQCLDAYKWALSEGIAKECARMLLPMATTTKLYMNGTIRSWMHYLQLRTHESTQLEHREIALEIEQILKEQLPIIYEAYKQR